MQHIGILCGYVIVINVTSYNVVNNSPSLLSVVNVLCIIKWQEQRNAVRPNSFSDKQILTKCAVWLSRANLRILIRLLTGHADLNQHLALMRIRTDAACPLCQEDEVTVLLLLVECSVQNAM